MPVFHADSTATTTRVIIPTNTELKFVFHAEKIYSHLLCSMFFFRFAFFRSIFCCCCCTSFTVGPWITIFSFRAHLTLGLSVCEKDNCLLKYLKCNFALNMCVFGIIWNKKYVHMLWRINYFRIIFFFRFHSAHFICCFYSFVELKFNLL